MTPERRLIPDVNIAKHESWLSKIVLGRISELSIQIGGGITKVIDEAHAKLSSVSWINASNPFVTI